MATVQDDNTIPERLRPGQRLRSARDNTSPRPENAQRSNPPRTGRQTNSQVSFRVKLNIISGPYRAHFHEILLSVTGKSDTHKDIQHVVHVRLDLQQGQFRVTNARASGSNGSNRYSHPRQNPPSMRVASRPDDIMDKTAETTKSEPINRIRGNRSHRAHERKT